MIKPLRTRVFAAVVLCCFIVGFFNGYFNLNYLAPEANDCKTGVCISDAKISCKHLVTDKTNHRVSATLFTAEKNLTDYTFTKVSSLVKNTGITTYYINNPFLEPTFTSTLSLFPFHHFI